jgi:hypothetical protein
VFEKIHWQVPAPYPIGRIDIEKSDGMPKSVGPPSKFCGENFQGIITSDESWFFYLIESNAMFAFSFAQVNPKA